MPGSSPAHAGSSARPVSQSIDQANASIDAIMAAARGVTASKISAQNPVFSSTSTEDLLCCACTTMARSNPFSFVYYLVWVGWHVRLFACSALSQNMTARNDKVCAYLKRVPPLSSSLLFSFSLSGMLKQALFIIALPAKTVYYARIVVAFCVHYCLQMCFIADT